MLILPLVCYNHTSKELTNQVGYIKGNANNTIKFDHISGSNGDKSCHLWGLGYKLVYFNDNINLYRLQFLIYMNIIKLIKIDNDRFFIR